MLSFSIGDRVKAPDAHDLPDSLATSVVGIGIGAEDAAKVCFEPKPFGCWEFFASLVDTVALY